MIQGQRVQVVCFELPKKPEIFTKIKPCEGLNGFDIFHQLWPVVAFTASPYSWSPWMAAKVKWLWRDASQGLCVQRLALSTMILDLNAQKCNSWGKSQSIWIPWTAKVDLLQGLCDVQRMTLCPTRSGPAKQAAYTENQLVGALHRGKSSCTVALPGRRSSFPSDRSCAHWLGWIGLTFQNYQDWRCTESMNDFKEESKCKKNWHGQSVTHCFSAISWMSVAAVWIQLK